MKKIILKVYLNLIITLSITSLNAQVLEGIYTECELMIQRGVFDNSQYHNAVACLDEMIQKDSSSCNAYHLRMKANFRLNKIKPAIEDVTRAIEKCRHKLREQHLAVFFRERAEIYDVLGDTFSSMKDINQSIALDADSWEAYDIRANYHLKAGNFREVLSDFNNSINIYDNDAYTYIGRAKTKLKLLDTLGSCKDLKRAVDWGIDEYQPWVDKYCK